MSIPLASAYGSLESVPPIGAPSLKQQQRGREWITTFIVVPMLSIVLVAGVAAVMTVTCDPHESIEDTINTGMNHPPVVDDPDEHAPLFPLTASDYYGIIFSIGGLVIAAGGGIGGGGILVPIYILVWGFSPKHAIPLSGVTVFGGAIANMMLNVSKRHPLADRPLIDWDLILAMEPLTVAGALIGAFLNKVLPELLLTVLLVLFLSFTAWETFTKATKMYKKETLAMKNQSKLSELTPLVAEAHESAQAGDKLLDNMEERVEGTEEALTQKQEQDEVAQILDEERKTSRKNVTILVSLFVVVLAINVLKGGGGTASSPLGVDCGKTGFWAANGIMLAWILFTCVYVRQYLIDKCEAKQRCGYQYVEGDIQWDERATVVYPCLSCFAGFISGMFGVGGGMVTAPLMLAIGVHPAVASATTASMILFTSFTATTSYVVFGLLVPDYAALCLVVGFFSTFAGQMCLMYMMKKSQRNSYIGFSIGVVVLLSAVFMTIQSLLSMAAGEHHHSGDISGG